jgi:hypothetical protein
LDRYLELLYGGRASESSRKDAATVPKTPSGEKSEISSPEASRGREKGEISQQASTLNSLNSLISRPPILSDGDPSTSADRSSSPLTALVEVACPDSGEGAAAAGAEGGDPSGGYPSAEADQNFQEPASATSGALKPGKTSADDAHPSPTAAQRRRWADAADQVDKALGRHQRGDISRRRWQQMRADVRGFVESGWAHRAHRLGWHLLELFGVDRRVPYARYDRRGLALILDGSKVIDLTRHSATIETASGAHLTYTRRRIEFLDVVLIDQIAQAYRLAIIRREWTEVLELVDRCLRPLHADVSDTRWQQYRADLRRLADENWDYSPIWFMDWDGRGCFPTRAKRALAWRIDGGTITNLTHDTAICGKVVFRRLPGDQGWQKDVDPDQGRKKASKWLAD